MGALAAHVVGHIGEISAERARGPRGSDGAGARGAGEDRAKYRPGDLIGKVGVERVYEDWLAGKPGVRKIAVDVRGEPVQGRGWRAAGTRLGRDPHASTRPCSTRPRTRSSKASSSRSGLTDPDSGEKFKAPAGAVVALDPRSGEVLALASQPGLRSEPVRRIGAARRAGEAELAGCAHAVPEPRDRRSRAAGIDVQAADGCSGVGRRARPARTGRSLCPGYLKIGNRDVPRLDAEGPRHRRPVPLARRVVRHRLLHARRRDGPAEAHVGEPLQKVARDFGFGKPTGSTSSASSVASSRTRSGSGTASRTRRRSTAGGSPVTPRTSRSDRGSCRRHRSSSRRAYAAIANRRDGLPSARAQVPRASSTCRSRPRRRACDSGIGAGVGRAEGPRPRGHRRRERSSFIEGSMRGTVRGDGTAAPPSTGSRSTGSRSAGKTGTAQMKPKQPFSWFAAIAKAGGQGDRRRRARRGGGHRFADRRADRPEGPRAALRRAGPASSSPERRPTRWRPSASGSSSNPGARARRARCASST